ncbi:MAG: YdeI/OmpD-associated family protein [Planctomycetes bacterium]|nr:YdeI/OmpD-associated family protein [Planctomycetota bacterium]
MVTRDPRIDAYIENAPDFARPVLETLRAWVHAACPDVVETMKWRNPSFDYGGLLCGFAAFKRHCTFGFWKHTLVCGDTDQGKEAWGSFGRITSPRDLPSKTAMIKLIKKAMQLNVDGVKVQKPKRAPRPRPQMPAALAQALAADATARAQWTAFSPSRQREYMEWIGEAKTDATRARRLDQAMQWIAAGKPRNWKYMKC